MQIPLLSQLLDERSRTARVVGAAALLVLAWGVHVAIEAGLGGQSTYAPFLIGVMVAAVLYGLVMGLVAVLGAVVILMLTVHGPWLGAGDAASMMLFIAGGVLVSFIGALARRAGRHQEALREGQGKYRALFDSIDEGFCIIRMIEDEAGRAVDYEFLEMNRSFERQSGLTDVSGRRMRELVPDHDPWWFEIYGEVARTGEAQRLEREARALGRWFDVYAFRVGKPGEGRVAVLFTDITQRKGAEEQLRRNHETFASLIRNSPFGLYVIDADFRLVEVSAGAQRVFKSVRPLLGRDFAEVMRTIWPEPFASDAIGHFRHTLATGEPYHAPRTIEGRRDVELTESYDWRIERITLPDGRYGVVCNFYDLSERTRYEAALEASERRLEEIFDRAPAFMAVLRGPKLVFEKANQAYLQIVGGRDIVGKSLLEALPEVVDQPYPKMLAKVMESGEAVEGRSAQVRLTMSDGMPETKTVDFVYLPLRDADGRIAGVLAHGVDLTERVRAEEALRRSEERYRAVVESQAEMVCRFRRDGTLLFVNGAYARARGRTPEELVGVNFWSWIDEADRPTIETMLDSLSPESPEVRIENRFGTSDGLRWTLWHNRALVFDEAGRPVEFQSAGIDITDRRSAEEGLRRANSDLMQFASAASHDLKEPLRGVSRLASFISQDDPGISAESRQRLERIRALCSRLTTMVSGLIDHARTGLEPRLEACDLNEVLRRVVDTSAEELAAGGCEVVLRGRLPVVHGDPVLMERVFANLIANAVKFNESPVKRVEFFWEAGQGPSGGAVAVRDNGIGIDPKHQQHIFRIFRRMHAPEQYPGEGLGLALAKKIIEAHGGMIDVESAVGAGSTFRMRLPVILPGDAGAEEQPLVSPVDQTACRDGADAARV